MKFDAGFIGVGNMGGALASAVYQSSPNLAVCDKSEEKTAAFLAAHPAAAAAEMYTVAAESRFLFLAVKPNVILSVARMLADSITDDTVVVTMAAGVPLCDIADAIETGRCIRIMPNTPCAAEEGTVLYSVGSDVTPGDEAAFLDLMQFSGMVDKIDEKLIDAAAALSGCGPAFVYMFAEALADGAVRCGLPRDKAMRYAVQTIYGSAAMMKVSGKHPGQLKDEVCSPGGTTIEGVLALEEHGFRAAAAAAVTAAYDKTAKLGK